MKSMKALPSFLFAAMILTASTAALLANPADITPADAATFQDHLVKNKLHTQWEGPPKRIDSDELRRAYANLRFYFTFAPTPTPPGAPLPDVIERYNQQVRDHEKRSLRIAVGIDDKQSAHTFRTARDFNHGLIPIKTDDDARLAAAAILSLKGGDSGLGDSGLHPKVISAGEVTVTRTQAGWTCVVERRMQFTGKVEFNSEGSCTGVEKMLNHQPSLPPSIAPSNQLSPQPMP